MKYEKDSLSGYISVIGYVVFSLSIIGSLASLSINTIIGFTGLITSMISLILFLSISRIIQYLYEIKQLNEMFLKNFYNSSDHTNFNNEKTSLIEKKEIKKTEININDLPKI